MILGNVGIALAAACAATINHVLDRRIDEQMARTRGRPFPTGAMNERKALTFAAVLGTTSMVILAFFVNRLTAVLTFASLIGYAGDLHGVAQARDVAEHRDRRCGRRGAARARLDGGDQPRRSARAAAVPDHLRLDAAALLGAGDRAAGRLREGGHSDAARHARRGIHAPASAAVHGAAIHRDAAAVSHAA